MDKRESSSWKFVKQMMGGYGGNFNNSPKKWINYITVVWICEISRGGRKIFVLKVWKADIMAESEVLWWKLQQLSQTINKLYTLCLMWNKTWTKKNVTTESLHSKYEDWWGIERVVGTSINLKTWNFASKMNFKGLGGQSLKNIPPILSMHHVHLNLE